jgi:hypothetical protein
MPVYVLRNGELVEKGTPEARQGGPYISRFESYESPIDDKTISSHRQRDMDLYRSNSYDVRDTGPNHAFTRAKEARKADNGRSNPAQLDFWR